jgi:hypothetical protein
MSIAYPCRSKHLKPKTHARIYTEDSYWASLNLSFEHNTGGLLGLEHLLLENQHNGIAERTPQLLLKEKQRLERQAQHAKFQRYSRSSNASNQSFVCS